MIDGARFAALFPISFRVISHPVAVFAAAMAGAVVAAPFSLHYSASIILLALTAIFVGSESRFLDALLLPPTLLAARAPVMGGVIGAAYMASGMMDGDNAALLAIQAGMMYWLLASWVMNRACLRGVPGIRMPWNNRHFTAECLRPLAWVAIAILLLELVRQIVGLATGALDRGVYGDAAARQAFGIWTYFSIFPRMTSSCMFLAPVIWRGARAPMKAIGLSVVVLLFLVGFSTGSRALFLTPLGFLIMGIYFFIPLRRVPLETIVGLSVLVMTPLVLAMATHRSTEEFRKTPGWDVATRVRGMVRAATVSGETYDVQTQAMRNRFFFGVQMLGVSDQIVYEKTPSESPHVGLENVERILYVWIPKFFMRDKPYLQDGNDIVVGYTGVFYERSQSTISLTADLYRRFGLFGILGGVPLAALFSGLFTRWIFRTLLFRDALLGIVLLQLLISAFHAEWWSTLLSSSFDWLYAIPKHLVFIYLLVGAARLVTGQPTKRGLLAYAETA